MAANFPTSLPSITRVLPTDYMNDPGKEADLLHNEIADEIEALAAVVGITGTSDVASIENRVANVVPQRLKSISNNLVSIQPTRVCTPVNAVGAAGYTSTLTGGATIAVDVENTDPLSGLGTAKLVMGGGDSSVQTVQFDSLPNGGVDPTTAGIWIVPVWLDEDYSVTDGSVSVALRFSHLTTPTGSDYRTYGWFSGSLHSGWNILMCRNEEVSIGNAQYGVVGHMPLNTGQVWTEGGGATTSSSVYLSARVRVYAPGRTVHVGGIYLAHQNWATGIVCWGFDDCLDTVRTLALPVIESFGWKASIFSTVHNATNYASYMSLSALRTAQSAGHDVISHTLSHYDMTTGTQQEKDRQARETRSFWKSNGFPTAGEFGSFPFLTHNKTAMSTMSDAGYKAVRAGAGRFLSPAAPLCSPFNLPAFSIEPSNSWHVDALLNGAIARRQVAFAYGHAPIVGGSGIDTSPGATQFYLDHLTRWCQLVQAKEAAGECRVMTFSEALMSLGLVL